MACALNPKQIRLLGDRGPRDLLHRDHFLTKRLPRIERTDWITRRKGTSVPVLSAHLLISQRFVLLRSALSLDPSGLTRTCFWFWNTEYVPSFCSQELKKPGTDSLLSKFFRSVWLMGY